MKRIIAVALIIGFSLSCKPDLNKPVTSIEDEVYFSQLFDLIATPDGGFLTGATRYHSIATVTSTDLFNSTYQYDPASTYADLMVIKTDAAGNRQWEKVLEKPDDQLGKKLLLPNGNYLLAGNVTNKFLTKHDVILSELSPDGQERSSRQLATPATELRLNDARTGPTGDLFMTGYRWKAGDFAKIQADWISRLSPDGSSTRWSLSATDSTKLGLAEGVLFDFAADGDLFVVGYRPVNNSSQAYFRKISPDGVVRWMQDANNVRGFIPRQLYTTTDGGFVVAGAGFRTPSATTRQIVLLKADGSGKIQSDLWFDPGVYGDYERAFLSKRPDGTFALATVPGNRLWVSLLNANGSSHTTVTTDITLSVGGTPVFLALANGDLLLVERTFKSLQPKEVIMRRIGSNGREIWKRVISSL